MGRRPLLLVRVRLLLRQGHVALWRGLCKAPGRPSHVGRRRQCTTVARPRAGVLRLRLRHVHAKLLPGGGLLLIRLAQGQASHAGRARVLARLQDQDGARRKLLAGARRGARELLHCYQLWLLLRRRQLLCARRPRRRAGAWVLRRWAAAQSAGHLPTHGAKRAGGWRRLRPGRAALPASCACCAGGSLGLPARLALLRLLLLLCLLLAALLLPARLALLPAAGLALLRLLGGLRLLGALEQQLQLRGVEGQGDRLLLRLLLGRGQARLGGGRSHGQHAGCAQHAALDRLYWSGRWLAGHPPHLHHAQRPSPREGPSRAGPRPAHWLRLLQLQLRLLRVLCMLHEAGEVWQCWRRRAWRRPAARGGRTAARRHPQRRSDRAQRRPINVWQSASRRGPTGCRGCRRAAELHGLLHGRLPTIGRGRRQGGRRRSAAGLRQLRRRVGAPALQGARDVPRGEPVPPILQKGAPVGVGRVRVGRRTGRRQQHRMPATRRGEYKCWA